MDGAQAPPATPLKPLSSEERAAQHRLLKDESEREATETVRRARKSGTKATPASGTAKAGPTLTRGDAIKLTPVSWLWGGWLARGKLHVMAGAPGTGKTTASIDLAATVTKGGIWPDGTQAAAGDVLIWSGEDDPEDTLAPRLLAAGADMKRVNFIGGFIDDQGPRSFDPATDVYSLNRLLSETKLHPSLLIVDPLVSAVSADSHKNAEVRRSLAPLVELAQNRNCAVLGISHFSKGTQGRDPTERVTGSLAFGALARVVFAVAKIPDHEGGGRILVRSKNNLGPDTGGFRFDLESYQLQTYQGIYATRVAWGEALEGSAREILGMAETETTQEDKTERQEAGEWLRELLIDGGDVAVKEVKERLSAAGFSYRVGQYAREDIGATVVRRGKGGPCFWRLGATEDRTQGQYLHEETMPARHKARASIEAVDISDDSDNLPPIPPILARPGECASIASIGTVYGSDGPDTAPDEAKK
jgi:putative DNA primase/helicase